MFEGCAAGSSMETVSSPEGRVEKECCKPLADEGEGRKWMDDRHLPTCIQIHYYIHPLQKILRYNYYFIQSQCIQPSITIRSWMGRYEAAADCSNDSGAPRATHHGKTRQAPPAMRMRSREYASSKTMSVRCAPHTEGGNATTRLNTTSTFT